MIVKVKATVVSIMQGRAGGPAMVVEYRGRAMSFDLFKITDFTVGQTVTITVEAAQ